MISPRSHEPRCSVCLSVCLSVCHSANWTNEYFLKRVFKYVFFFQLNWFLADADQTLFNNMLKTTLSPNNSPRSQD